MTLALNEDNSHFFCWHPREEMSLAGLDAWLDQYAGTQVVDLLFCPNGQRSSVPSRVRQTAWDGFDPEQGNDQPFFQGMRDQPFLFPWGARAHMRRWVEHAWLLHHLGIDPYARWAARCRSHWIRPWLSMRMNDVHYVDQPNHPIHDRFWKEHPEYRRDPAHDAYNGNCLDYGVPEVRTYQLAYVRELIARYDVDGFELDWMRNPFHFKPGTEVVGCAALTGFVRQVRGLLDARQRQVGHPIRLGARVPSRPETALGLGMDAVAWANHRFVDKLVITPFFSTTEFDMPIERWKALLKDTGTTLAAGLEFSVRMQAGAHTSAHTLETLRGAASSLLDRGADQIYLFNFMDNYPAGTMGDAYRRSVPAAAYRRMLRQIGELDTIVCRSRRHVVTSPDVWAPDEEPIALLPRDCPAGGRVVFRIPAGPAPREHQAGQVRFAVEPHEMAGQTPWTVEVNGAPCHGIADVMLEPDGAQPVQAFAIPAGALRRGDALVELQNEGPTAKRLAWVELAISDGERHWPAAGEEATSLYPGWGRW
jgi:hypothetical protein